MTRDGRPATLWAPWRLPFIKGSGRRRRGCFFCDYARRRRDRENRVVLRGKVCFAVLNRYPYNSGHVMVAPLAHKGALGRLTEEERRECFALLVALQEALRSLMKPDGYNVGLNLGKAAGAGVPGHLHFHLVPRWHGDTNFMPVVGGAKVIPESLAELHGRLQKALAKRR